MRLVRITAVFLAFVLLVLSVNLAIVSQHATNLPSAVEKSVAIHRVAEPGAEPVIPLDKPVQASIIACESAEVAQAIIELHRDQGVEAAQQGAQAAIAMGLCDTGTATVVFRRVVFKTLVDGVSCAVVATEAGASRFYVPTCGFRFEGTAS